MPFLRKRGDLVVYEVIAQLPSVTYLRGLDARHRYASTTFPIQNSTLYNGKWMQCDIYGTAIKEQPLSEGDLL